MFLQYIKRTIKFVGGFLLMALILRAFFIEPGTINGASMEPTFVDAENFLVNKGSLLFRKPKRGEVVLVKGLDPGEIYIKRIVGLPGERLSIHDGLVYLVNENGGETRLDEPYLSSEIKTTSYTGGPAIYMEIPRHSYFLLGDNRSHSVDSRKYGSFHRSEIFGLVLPFTF